MRKKRSVKENSKVNDSDSLYRTPQSLGKAASKAAKALPLDINHRIAVLHELCEQNGIAVLKRRTPQFLGTFTRDCIYQAVETFFLRDDVSRQAPGLKDTCYIAHLKQKVYHHYV
jgi:hypothetical protein